MSTITCLIVEDEPRAMRLLEDYMNKVPFMKLCGKCYDATEALAFLQGQQVDVIFLDINMPLLTGLEMAAMVPKDQKIIFTTAYSEYAIESFDYHVVDYLLKPITFNRFMQALTKLQVWFPQKKEIPLAHGRMSDQDMEDHLFVKSGRQIYRLPFDTVLYIEALKEYVCIYTKTEKLLVYKRMKEMTDVLPAQFVRIHNSYIINMKHIEQVDSQGVTVAGKQLPVSSGYKDGFRERIDKLMV